MVVLQTHQKAIFENYVSSLRETFRTGIATEHSYRHALKSLIERLFIDAIATNDPKFSIFGKPDFTVSLKDVPTGFIETKDLDETDLSQIESSKQLKDYRRGCGVLILTNYLEFRLYVNGMMIDRVSIGRLDDLKIKIDPNTISSLLNLLIQFIEAKAPTITSSKELASRLSSFARRIKTTIMDISQRDIEDVGRINLENQLGAFKEVLLDDLDMDKFSDMYAQTISYGMFAARFNSDRTLISRASASDDLPKTNPFLKKVFGELAKEDMDDDLIDKVDNLIDLLNRADTKSIGLEFASGPTGDASIHFYETFLAEYDPQLRKKRGVYYTPQQVVSFIVRSTHEILKDKFRIGSGLADKTIVSRNTAEGSVDSHQVIILDPATGTGTFLQEVLSLVHKEVGGDAKSWSEYVQYSLLPRLFGFELLMAPYAVAHMKMGLELKRRSFDFPSDQRLNIFMTNTLEETRDITSKFPFARWLSEEARSAGAIKKKAPVMVVLGNPPYAVSSQNKGEWIDSLLEDYKKGLNEKKLNLDDDYIKFYRFAQWRIEQTGYGVLAYISNNSFLDGLTHRQMRKTLMGAFDEIYVLDLHGNSNRKETCPDGSRDENVFDIKQGVSINIFIRRKSVSPSAVKARVFHADVWGDRVSKYDYLDKNSWNSVDWKELSVDDINSFFVPKDFSKGEEYQKWWRIQDIFRVYQNGIKTDRDALLVDKDASELKRRIRKFYSADALNDESFVKKYNVEDSSSYSLIRRRASTTYSENHVKRFLYRPFDLRWLYYNRQLVSRPAWDVMSHMVERDNISLITSRQTKDHWGVFASRFVGGHKAVAAYDINTYFPCYVFEEPLPLAGPNEKPKAIANFSARFVEWLTSVYGPKIGLDLDGEAQMRFCAKSITEYAYAAMWSSSFREEYIEFLKIDFPRIPFVKDGAIFEQMRALGETLILSHANELSGQLLASYEEGENLPLAKFEYQEDGERIQINEDQYINDITPQIWAFKVGGYQVIERWLRENNGKLIGKAELLELGALIERVRSTISVVAEVDLLVLEQGGWAAMSTSTNDLLIMADGKQIESVGSVKAKPNKTRVSRRIGLRKQGSRKRAG